MRNPYTFEERALGTQCLCFVPPQGPLEGPPARHASFSEECTCAGSAGGHASQGLRQTHRGQGEAARRGPVQGAGGRFCLKPFATPYPEKQPLGSDTQLGSFVYVFFICKRPQNKNWTSSEKYRWSLRKVSQGWPGNPLNLRTDVPKITIGNIFPLEGSHSSAQWEVLISIAIKQTKLWTGIFCDNAWTIEV